METKVYTLLLGPISLKLIKTTDFPKTDRLSIWCRVLQTPWYRVFHSLDHSLSSSLIMATTSSVISPKNSTISLLVNSIKQRLMKKGLLLLETLSLKAQE